MQVLGVVLLIAGALAAGSNISYITRPAATGSSIRFAAAGLFVAGLAVFCGLFLLTSGSVGT